MSFCVLGNMLILLLPSTGEKDDGVICERTKLLTAVLGRHLRRC